MNKTDKIYVADHRGMVGSVIVGMLKNEGFENLVTRTQAELDLLDQQTVTEFIEAGQPEFVQKFISS